MTQKCVKIRTLLCNDWVTSYSKVRPPRSDPGYIQLGTKHEMGRIESELQQESWRGLPVFDAIGRKFHLTTREMRHSAPDPWMIVWDLLAVAILVLANVHGYRESLSIPIAAVLWLSMILTVTVFYLSILLICIAISKRFFRFAIYFPVVGIISMTASTFLSNYYYSLFSGEIYTFELASSHLLFNLLLGFLFETLFMFFVYPVILAGIGDDKDSGETADLADRIVIAGKTFLVNEIGSISSQDHYLEVKTDTSSELLRGRLTDVVGQLPDEYGVTPHRSHWVSRRAIEGIGGKSGAKTLVLKDGTSVPIARARVVDVRAWLDGI